MDLRLVTHVEELILPEGSYWYLITPYSKFKFGLDAAADEALEISNDLEYLKINHFAPIPATHDSARRAGVDPLDHDLWQDVDEPWIRRAHGGLVAMMPGWEESRGCTHERKIFTAFERPLLYLPRDFVRKAATPERRASR